MSLERIRHSILEKAQKKADTFVEEALANFKRTIGSARVALREDREKRLKTLAAESEEQKNRSLATLRAEHRMQLLSLKTQLIDDIFTQAINKIITLPDEEYLSLLERWLLKTERDQSGRLFVNATDLKRIGHAWIERMNISRGKGEISLSPDPVAIKGGFIFKTEKFEIDYTLDTLLNTLREELSPHMARELFDERGVST